MKRCLDIDQLVALSGALDWQVEELLDHLLVCSDCRQQLGRLATLHGALSTLEPVLPELVDAVMKDISSPQARRTLIERALTRGLTAMLAGMTTFFSVALVASGTSSLRWRRSGGVDGRTAYFKNV